MEWFEKMSGGQSVTVGKRVPVYKSCRNQKFGNATETQDFAFYRECFEKMDMDFSKDNFPYTSSQYRKFSNEVLQRAFGFTEEELGEY